MNWTGKTIGLAIGGDSAEAEVSRSGGKAIQQAFETLGLCYKVLDGIDAVRKASESAEVDCVFNLIHGEKGEDGVLQGLLEALGMPYTGSGLQASALTMNKEFTKYVWKASGLPVANSVVISEVSEIEKTEIPDFPVVVKPNCGGSSLGVAFVKTKGQLNKACETIIASGDDALVEQQIIGREYTAAILGSEALPLIEIVAAEEFYDYEAKYQSEETNYICPCDLTEEQEFILQEMMLKAYRVCGCSGWGRVDFMIDEQGDAVLLEVNTTPGMTSHSLVPKAAKAKGISFDGLVMRILESCIPRMRLIS